MTSSSDPARTVTLVQRAPAPAGDGLATGVQLGHFRIDRRLGAGGMGEVYLANDLALDRPVAIKVLPSGVATGAARERLVREARAQARIQHPNVGHIYFVGEDAGRLYFAMEYIAGSTFAELIATDPLQIDEALALIHAAVLGLREAQRAGFTHRDVKPSNLMRDAHGVVKVVDFGLVAAIPERGDGPVAQTTLAGTPLYMAPEQARGEPIDHRADIYALGATLFHLLSGRPPFRADTAAELASLHATAARPALPRRNHPRTAIAAIDRLVAHMMAARAEERHASYDELLRAIEQVLADRARPAGFWVRALATAIDLAIAAGLVTVAQIVAPHAGFDFANSLLPIAVPFSVLAIALRGATPGKALLDLQVIAVATGGRPTWRQAIVRQLLLAGPSGAIAIVARQLGRWTQIATTLTGTQVTVWGTDLLGALALGAVLATLALLAHAALRVPAKRAPWDRMSGTQVRYRPR